MTSHIEADGIPVMVQLALKNKILTMEQVSRALVHVASERRKGHHARMEDYFLENGIIDPETMSRLAAATVRHLDKLFGVLAVKSGLVDQPHMAKALEAQKLAFAQGTLKPVSDILMEWKLLTGAQRDLLLEKLSASGQTADDPGIRSAAPAPPEPPDEPGLSARPVDEPDDTLKAPSLVFTDQDMKVFFRFPQNTAPGPTLGTVKELLGLNGVIFGILPDETIEAKLAEAEGGSRECLVAEGTPGTPPRNATVTLYFKTDYLNPGKITEDGTIDFRERGHVPFVQAGTLLAEKMPGIDGTPGTNVFGQTLPADKALDQPLKSGAGTRSSDDGLQIFADQDGQPFMTVHGDISVFQELHIKGDVDYTTGNITFDGNIFVKGAVKPGFTVKGGNLTAREIEGAVLDIKGNIDVSGGISDSTITLGGTLQAMFMTSSKVDAYGDILVKKEIIDSKIRTSGACNGDKVTLIASFVSAREGIRVMRVGTDVSQPCTLRAGINDHTKKAVNRIRAVIEEKKTLLDAIQKKNDGLVDHQKALHQQIMEKSILQDKLTEQKKTIEAKLDGVKMHAADDPRHDKAVQFLTGARAHCDQENSLLEQQVAELFAEQDSVTDAILNLQDQCEPLVQTIEELNARIRDIHAWEKRSRGRSLIQVIKEIQAQTSVAGPNSTLILKETRKNVTIRETRHTTPSGPTWELIVETN
ncbi:hypothetical protein JCM14469_19560 [Desulfatiferula olefinivorans]